MGKIVGIDLGTTYSAVAAMGTGGKPEILVNRDGERIMPSVVMFSSDDTVLVGTMALRSAPTAPFDVVQFIKRQMANPAFRFEASDGQQYTPEEISALILRRLKEDAAAHLEEVTDAVITVPAYFDDAKRRATMDAGRIAGLNVVRVLNEPTAAALAFGLDTASDGTYAIFDLGGGTFDITVLRLGEGEFDVIGTDGLHELGGFEWDNRLIEHLNAEFQAQGGLDLTEDEGSAADLRDRAELAKRTLSQAPAAKVALSSGGTSTVLTVTRTQFEEMTVDLLNQARDLTESVISEHGLDWSDITGTLLVGGSTRMPMVAQMIEQLTGKPPLRSGNPDELVALGAAIQAALEQPSATDGPAPLVDGRPIRISDVTSQALGVIAFDDSRRERNFVILPRNSKIPTQGYDDFETMADGQTELRVRVTQGDDPDPEWIIQVGEQVISIPPYPAQSPIRMVFSYDVDQTVHIEAVDLQTERSLGAFEVRNVANLTDEELSAARQKNKRLEVS